MWVAGPFSFCALCGAHTRVSLRKLATKCPKRVISAAMQRALDRLRLGQHPTEDSFLGQPSPYAALFPPAEWQEVGGDSDYFSLAEVTASLPIRGPMPVPRDAKKKAQQ